MKLLKKIAFLGICFIFIFSLTGCGGELPEIQKSKISQDIETELSEAGYSYDTINDLTYEFVDINDDDLTKLKEFFDNRVDYQKVDTSFKLSSISMDVTGQWSMVYAYVNGEWTVMFSYQKNPDEWEFTAKETVSSKKILSDLKTVDFEGFEEGYVGNEKTTSIKVVDRDTKFNINKDDVYIEAKVKTDFAEYVIEIEMIYYFENGEWTLSDAIVEDAKFWQLTYNSDKVPSSPSMDYILEQLTKSNNFLTYVANIDYMERYNLVETKQLAGVTSITFQYEFSAEYSRIGTIKYLIQIPYEWVDGEWAIGEMEVSVSDIDVEKMLGTWTASNGDYIEFTSVEEDKSSGYESANILVGTYYKKGESTTSEYSIKVKVEVPLRDNNYDCTIDSWEAKSMNSVEFKLNNMSLDVKAITLTEQIETKDSNGKITLTTGLSFAKTADLEIPDSIEEPTNEENSEETTESSESTEETSEDQTSSEVSSESSEEKTAIGG